MCPAWKPEPLGAYRQRFETLHNRQSRLNEIKHTLCENARVATDTFRSIVDTGQLDAQLDPGAAALICGRTNRSAGNQFFTAFRFQSSSNF